MSPSKRARALEADSGSGSSDWEDSSVDSTQEGEDKDTLGEVSGHDQDEESGKEGDKGSSEEDSDEEVVDKEVSGAWVAPSHSITLCTSSFGLCAIIRIIKK